MKAKSNDTFNFINSNTTALYLEDSKFLRMSAQDKAKKIGLELKVFSNSQDFLQALEDISENTFLFFDSNIGEVRHGEEIAKYCYDIGFKHLFMITSYDKSDFKDMYWIKDIGGKKDILLFWNRYNKNEKKQNDFGSVQKSKPSLLNRIKDFFNFSFEADINDHYANYPYNQYLYHELMYGRYPFYV